LVVDESIIQGRRILCIQIGCIDEPSKTYLLECVQLPSAVNAQMVCQAVDDALRYLETPREKFLLLLSDAAPYMIACGTTLKSMYSSLFHVTCVSHLLHNCALKIRSLCKSVDELIASVKLLVSKNKSRLNEFSEIGYPSQPVVTRWCTWLNATSYYSENFNRIRDIIQNMQGGGVLLLRAKSAIENSSVFEELVNIAKYKSLSTLTAKTESSRYTIREAAEDLASLNFVSYQGICGKASQQK